ncbi:MAG: preprotein translocase subunit SecA [Eubacteriales bacterium]
MGLFEKLLSPSSELQLRPLRRQADKVITLEPQFEKLSNAELAAKTAEFRERYSKGETLDSLLPEVFAQVREASWRILNMKHYYVQILGGIALHNGNIAEMKTGEGKTLVATLPICLNALSGEGVHLVTVNDYLAKRDSEWMGKIYTFLGYSVGLILKDMDASSRQKAYACDITYGTNNEFGFDYLRDNMVIYKERMVQRPLNYAIVDEVDSILIDEARTPLIISGRGDKSTEMYTLANKFVKSLKDEVDYTSDEKQRTINLTDDGIKKAESFFKVENLNDIENTELNHHITQALKANRLWHKDRDYVVVDNQIIIVDEFTGRLMTGRRYSDGLHQAIEAKENVHVKNESKTLATITFQNYFRMYKKLAGMTGTAKTEEDEFNDIYNLNVIEIPTHKPMIRNDLNDIVYATENAKFDAVVDEISRVHSTGQPILVGTVSVENSEILSKKLAHRGVSHQVLNAKYHEKEAEIVMQAGKLNTVTIATNMAGRGTDIILGGNPEAMAKLELRREGIDPELIEKALSFNEITDEELINIKKSYENYLDKFKAQTDTDHNKVVDLGGLYIIGTERHESRRIDNQLRGRSGRQGDPGKSKFYISLEDDLMRLFGGERIKMLMSRIDPDGTMPLEFKMLTKQIENSQKRIESKNFDIRRNVLNYDDVMNKQREIIYIQRRQVLTGEEVKNNILDMIETLVDNSLDLYCPPNSYPEEWNLTSLAEYLSRLFHVKELNLYTEDEVVSLTHEELKERILKAASDLYEQREKEFIDSGFNMRDIERIVMLRSVDSRWMDHIDSMDQLRQGIGLRAYGQRDPLVEYRMESFDMFDEMIKNIQEETVNAIYGVTVRKVPERKAVATATSTSAPSENTASKNTAATGKRKIGRNEFCPCGSGKKYKNCCGRNE